MAGRFTPLSFNDLTSRSRPAADATIAYGSEEMQKIDVWLPTGQGPHPVVLLVHGGCWTTSVADRSLMDWLAADLRASGIAVWNIDYRGVDRAGGGYPGTFLDAAAAADELLSENENIRRFNLDTSRVVAVGHSAGGHLALWLAARHRIPAKLENSNSSSPLYAIRPLPIRHVVSLGGLPDLEATAASPDNGCGTAVVGQLVGKDRADPFVDTSVPRLLPLGVPQDLINGREDRIIPYRLATEYAAKAEKAGDRVTLHTVPDTDHFELIAPETAAWAQAKRIIQAALSSSVKSSKSGLGLSK